jgi:hypothetical protein
MIIRRLLKKLVPRELHLPHEDGLEYEEAELIEYTQLRAWMVQWLAWVEWYTFLWIKPRLMVGDLFQAPICFHSYSRSNRDITVFRYGLLWQCYDWCGRTSLALPLALGDSLRSGYVLWDLNGVLVTSSEDLYLKFKNNMN